jgi:ribosomal protein S12 methylthiotransferase
MPAAAPSTSPFTILSGKAAETRAGQESQAGTHKTVTAIRAEGDAREQQGRFRRDDWQGATAHAADVSLRRGDSALSDHAQVFGLHQDCRGCDHPCSFCVIPNLRGKFRSRRFESVVAEARQLVARGVEEITLIGQDTTCYGEDLGLKDGLASLLDALAGIEGLRWLRFLYAYPNRITTGCWRRLPSTTTSASISTCRCSTLRPPC